MIIPTLHRSTTRAFFFWTGLVATIAYRAIIFFTEANPVALRIIWYIGTIGFTVYFIHRFQVASRRARVIRELKLDQTVPKLSELSDEQRAGMSYVFATLKSSRERWNYYIIFLSSAVALVAGAWMDLMR